MNQLRHEINSVDQLRDLQRRMAGAIMRPLVRRSKMQPLGFDGCPMTQIANEFIRPNKRLTSFDRLEIYNRQYWFRILDCFSDDFIALRAVLGNRKFDALAEAYLTRYPSESFTLRNLGSRLEQFLREEPRWTAPYQPLALDVVRLEWAQVTAFDSEAKTILTTDDLLRQDPSNLKLHLQPYLCLLDLNYPVDDFVIALKKHEALQNDASNAIEGNRRTSRTKKIKLPKCGKTYIAVHRLHDSLYYKRLERKGFQILTALREGMTLEAACATVFHGQNNKKKNWLPRIQKWFQNWMSLGWFHRNK